MRWAFSKNHMTMVQSHLKRSNRLHIYYLYIYIKDKLTVLPSHKCFPNITILFLVLPMTTNHNWRWQVQWKLYWLLSWEKPKTNLKFSLLFFHMLEKKKQYSVWTCMLGETSQKLERGLLVAQKYHKVQQETSRERGKKGTSKTLQNSKTWIYEHQNSLSNMSLIVQTNHYSSWIIYILSHDSL